MCRKSQKQLFAHILLITVFIFPCSRLFLFLLQATVHGASPSEHKVTCTSFPTLVVPCPTAQPLTSIAARFSHLIIGVASRKTHDGELRGFSSPSFNFHHPISYLITYHLLPTCKPRTSASNGLKVLHTRFSEPDDRRQPALLVVVIVRYAPPATSSYPTLTHLPTSNIS